MKKISGISKSFFDNGEGMKGILVDAMADEYLFMMDDVLAENIKLLCAKSLGVLKNVLMHRKIFRFLNNPLLSRKQALTE